MTKAEIEHARVIADTTMCVIEEACITLIDEANLPGYVEFTRTYSYCCGVLYGLWRIGGLTDKEYWERVNDARKGKRIALDEEA